MQVEKRNGAVEPFSIVKIKTALQKASVQAGISSQQVDGKIDEVCIAVEKEVGERFIDSYPNVENLHDIVEKCLMRAELFNVVRAYIVHRAEKDRLRKNNRTQHLNLKKLSLVKANGKTALFNPGRLRKKIEELAEGLSFVSPELLYEETTKNLYDAIKVADVSELILSSALSFIERDPEYDRFAARLFLGLLRQETLGSSEYDEDTYKDSFPTYIRSAVKLGLLDARLLEFDLEALAEALQPTLDGLFPYTGLKTLRERYFVKNGRKLKELPQYFWMRVAMGLSLLEKDKEKWAIEFYKEMSAHRVIPSTPTLFHAGLPHSQLSSCYVLTVEDDLTHIFKTYGDCSQLSKYSGGIGVDWTNVRATLAQINSTKVESQGVIPFLKILDSTTVAINRSGKRRGATCAYLEIWHKDVEDFIDLRRNTGEDRRRTPDLNTALWIPDLFMQRVSEDGYWTLFSPDEVPDLHDLYGKAFEDKYVEYEDMVERGEIRLHKTVKAKDLIRKVVSSLFSTGHPWVVLKDPGNIRNPQKHVGTIHSSQLCCVAGDQRVPTDKGILTAKELYELGEENIIVGRDKFEKASIMLRPKQNSELVKIITKQGYEHKVTPDHKVWVDGQGYKEAKDLIIGDKLTLQSYEGMWGKLELEDEAWLIGLVTGDGSFTDNYVKVDIWDKKIGFSPNILNETKNCINRVIKKYSNIITLNKLSKQEVDWTVDERGRYRIYSVALQEIFSYLGFTKSNKTRVPEILWKATRKSISKYLEGLYYCDGSATFAKSNIRASLSSNNVNLLNDIQILLINFGVKTSVCKMHDTISKPFPSHKDGSTVYSECKPMFNLICFSKDGCTILEELTSIFTYRAGIGPTEKISSNARQHKQKYYSEFERLEVVENEDVYCLEVFNDDHLWICNGFLTKNTEIFLNTSKDECATCNLSSLNLKRFVVNGRVDYDLMMRSIYIQIRMLDNVIDINFYPIPEAKNSNLLHRPVGAGVMGTQDLLFELDVIFENADDIINGLHEFISFHSISASCDLAEERGPYPCFEGSEWSNGNLPIHTYNELLKRPHIRCLESNLILDWQTLSERARRGIRNSNLMAIAPTASISTIVGCYPSIEPQFSNIYLKSNMSGDFTIVNHYLIEELKKLGLWSIDTLNQLKYYDGNLSKIEKIPQLIKIKYRGVFDVDQKSLLRLSGHRQKYIDQGISHNIFYKGDSGNEVADLYMEAWRLGLKSTYYLRTLAASQIEKTTLEAPKACSILDPTCEACQ